MHILFLDPIEQTSKREHELRDAAARSHAATVAHYRGKKQSKASTSRNTPNDVRNASTGRSKMLRSDLSENVDVIPATPMYPNFGGSWNGLLDLLPYEARPGDLQVLDFFVEVTLPGIDVANEVFDNSGAFHFMLPNLIMPVSYHAIMGLLHLTSSMHFQTKVNPSMLMLEHRGRAMEKVRADLNRDDFQLSEALIVAIVGLSTIESALGNLRSYKLHLSALKFLQKERGHLELPSGQRLADMIAMYSDTTLALKTGKSAFERRTHEAIYQCLPLPVGIPLPMGFVLLIQQIPLSQDTISVLVNACKLGLGTPCVTLTHSQKVYLAGRRQTSRTYHNFLDSVPILLVPDNPGVLFEKMLILALSLFAWCGFNTVRCPQFGMYNAMITQLFERLVQFQPETNTEKICAAWMWLMVIDAWRIGGSDGKLLFQGFQVLRQFHQRFQGYRTWADTRDLTRLFFWTGDMENFWSKRWESLSHENP